MIRNFLIILFSVFLIFFIYKSFSSMLSTPFNEFDEAHRAETAKIMKEYKSFLVPLTGSTYDRQTDFALPLKNDIIGHIYYHIERPPLIYDLMILSSTFLGSGEWVYRLPSFIFGISTIFIFLIFAKLFSDSKKINLFALAVGLLCLITSIDLWLSSEYAQLDTGLTASLFLFLLSLIKYAESKKQRYLLVSGIGLGLAILSKGQPAIIAVLPIIYLLINKRLNFKDLFIFFMTTFLVISPWVFYLIYKFNLLNTLKVLIGFAFFSVNSDELFHKAPIFWYFRWWLETLRPGLIIFIIALFSNIIYKNSDWRKNTLATFILGSLLVFSLPVDKLWWYVLPLIPPLCFYIYLTLSKLIKDDNLINLGLIIVIASRPPLYGASNKVAVFYGLVTILVSIYLMFKLKVNSLRLLPLSFRKKILEGQLILLVAIIFSLVSFALRFPKIIPYHWNIKPVSLYFAVIPGNKCLWFYDMPSESVLFYTNQGEVYPLTASSKPFGHCDNYLITPRLIKDKKLIYKEGSIRLYNFNSP